MHLIYQQRDAAIKDSHAEKMSHGNGDFAKGVCVVPRILPKYRSQYESMSKTTQIRMSYIFFFNSIFFYLLL
jgi:hypothetical protein